jgi:hypothetical protein
MGLFNNNKREKPDIEFITKTNLKQVKFDGELKKRGRSREELIMTIPNNTSRQTVHWVLQIPFDTGHEAHFISTSGPSLTTNVDYGYRNPYEYEFMGHEHTNHQRTDLYVEFREVNTGTRLTQWIERSTFGGYGRKNLTLEMVDNAGTVIEQWNMVGCFPTEMRYYQEMFDTNPILGVNFSVDRAINVM